MLAGDPSLCSQSHCECLSGYVGLQDGACALEDACTPTSCHRDANCSSVGPGQFQWVLPDLSSSTDPSLALLNIAPSAYRCTCLPGYLGNGQVCYGSIMQRLHQLNTEVGGRWSSKLSSAISLFGRSPDHLLSADQSVA